MKRSVAKYILMIDGKGADPRPLFSSFVYHHRFDSMHVQQFKSRPMKQNQFRNFSLGCCIVASIISSATAAAPRSPSWIKLSPATSPPARSYLAMTYDPASGKVIMFDGFDGTGYLNEPGRSTGRAGHACRQLFRLRPVLRVRWPTTPSRKKWCSLADTTGQGI